MCRVAAGIAKYSCISFLYKVRKLTHLMRLNPRLDLARKPIRVASAGSSQVS
jgi:hypothetical protein